MPVTTIEWRDNKIRLVDQTRLPVEFVYQEIADVESLMEAIVQLRIRGAPAIGVAAAFGVLLGINKFDAASSKLEFFSTLNEVVEKIKNTRPTAVNLAWALNCMAAVAQKNHDQSISEIKKKLLHEAQRIYREDQKINRRLAEFGAELIPDTAQIITHCNTGALATVDYGTALGAVFAAHASGKKIHVWVDETRPLLQGARLNMWELQNEGIDCTLICDNMAAMVMTRHPIDLCIVGADRIVANGDTANKIGTYSLAVLAKHHGIPFYVAAPTSTFDLELKIGADIPIEMRGSAEITDGFGRRTAPEKSKVYSPAFDITPADMITAIITEKGILRPPYDRTISVELKNP